jgi:glycosyltransferase involved in cell wall biosynthesis
MVFGKKVVVVMPAYNAEKTLRETYNEIPHEYVDDVILVDDASRDNTAKLAKELDIKTFIHLENKGYGGNQKTCYREALKLGADVVIMLHPDYQYTPKLILAMASVVANGQYDVVLGSRILVKGVHGSGMPMYKYISNRVLTLIQNILLNHKISEYHTGYRAFSKNVLENLPLNENSDDFVFDNQMLAQAVYFGYSIGEISCPAKYFEEASSINFARSVKYGLGVLATSVKYRLQKWKVMKFRIFSSNAFRVTMKDDPRVISMK